MLRRALMVALVCAAAGVLGKPALAANPPVRPSLPYFVQTAHFKVWYNSDPLAPQTYTTQTQASYLAALAERAYTVETGWGYNPPPNDGDGLTDIYVVDLSTWPGVAGVAIPGGNTVPSSGSIDVGQSQLDTAWEPHVIAHELFHLIQFGYWLPATLDQHWLLEGEAEWAGYKFDAYGESAGTTDPPDLSLDCYDSIAGLSKCSPDGYANGGYSRWSFYEYLAQRFGSSFARDVLVQAQSANSALVGLSAAIAARGASLASVYSDFAARQMTGGWGIPALDAAEPPAAGSVVTGSLTADLGGTSYSVDHLATRYVTFQRGDGAADHPCFAATLTINVTLPAGVASQPYFYWNAKGSTPVALSVSGTSATASVPWDTCAWTNLGYLSLPNGSTNVDAAPYVVSTHLTVDQTTPAVSTAPPDQQPVYGGVTAVPSAESPPAINLLAPLLLHVSASDPTLRLIVQSTGDGSVHAVLAGVDLGSPTLRAGNNDLRFAVPKSLLTTLRRTADAPSSLLTLTPVSPSGAVTGAAVTRAVALTAAKPKAKHRKKK